MSCIQRTKSKCGLRCAEDTIAEVEMSYSQFAELITSMNCGIGIPVTIRYTEKDGYIEEECPFVGKQEEYQKEFTEHLKEVQKETLDTFVHVKELFSSQKTLKKSDKDDILRKLEHLYDQIGSNFEFVYKQFNEQIDKAINEAKGEIEAFCQNKMLSIAQSALVEH